jgi:SNF2 family DNA or RNA helicase
MVTLEAILAIEAASCMFAQDAKLQAKAARKVSTAPQISIGGCTLFCSCLKTSFPHYGIIQFIGGDLLNIKELEYIVFRPASSMMKEAGQKALNEGLVSKIEGKKIGSTYHIYGRVNNKTKSEEFSTHIKINLLNKTLENVKCTCDDFNELSFSGNLFMCSHLTATAYRFFCIIQKNKAKENEEQKENNNNNFKKQDRDTPVRLVRKATKDSTYYEVYPGAYSEKLKLKPEDLRAFIENLGDNKIKLKYDYLEFTAPIFHRNLPITFNLKDRDEFFVLTSHKQLPIPLNSNNDVILFKSEIYLPTKEQMDKYIPLYEKLKTQGEVIYRKDINNYYKLIYLLRSITEDINMAEGIKNFVSNALMPELLIYEAGSNIYCDVNVVYGNKKINIIKEDDSNELLTRDYKKEERILTEIEKYGFIKKNDRLMFIGGDGELFNILSTSREGIYSLGTVIFGKGIKDWNIYNSSAIEAQLYEKDGYFDFFYGIKGIENRELNSAFEAYKQNKSFYKSRSKKFIDFEDDGIRDFFNLLEILNIDKDIEDGQIQIEKSKALYLNEKIRNRGIEFIKGTEALQDIENKLLSINKMDIILPENLKGTLREYQVSGFKWLKLLSELKFGGILADEMGLGKTIETIAFILSEENKKSVIVCPTSLIYNWKDEFKKFAPSLKVAIVHGEKVERVKLIESFGDYDVILTTYGTLRMDIERYKNTVFDYCIIDEGQNIKNSQAQNTRVVKEIKAKGRFALTGTPIENNLSELWSIFDFVMPDYLYSKEAFEGKFIGKGDNLQELKLLIKPFILRRTKKEVMSELPDKIEKKFLVEMTSAQKAVYSSYIKLVRNELKNNVEGKIEVFSYLTKLRQICLDPSLIIEEYQGGSGKLKVAMDIIENHIASEGKMLLFSQFTSVLDNIGENLKEREIQYFRLDGSTKSKERIKLVNEFNDSEDIKVFLISLKAGGTGLNLTSANLVVHFDPWWNPAVENQATDRAHRIGQRNVVEVIKLIAKGTIEEKIILLQEDKKELIDSIITGELHNSNLINKLSKEELLQLFSRD